MPDVLNILHCLPTIYKGLCDKIHEDYYLHPLAVYKLLPEWADERMQVCALLHDVLEDTDINVETLKVQYGLTDEIIEDLQTLVHYPNEPYKDYIQRICDKGLHLALVKLCDITHNMDKDRLDKVKELYGQSVVDRLLKKYIPAMKILQEYITDKVSLKETVC